MDRFWLVFAVLLGTSLPQAAVAKERTSIARNDIARAEIQRILNSDNVDVEYSSARTVAESIAKIERGRAPGDFWAAYTQHVRAWRDFADAEEGANRVANQDPDSINYAVIALTRAEERVKTTFDEVERIALRYGAHMPIPPAIARRTT